MTKHCKGFLFWTGLVCLGVHTDTQTFTTHSQYHTNIDRVNHHRCQTLNRSGYGNGIGSGSGFRIRIPGQSAPQTKMYSNKFDVKPHSNVDSNPNFLSTRVVRNGYSERLGMGKSGGGGSGGDGMGKKREGDPVAEIVTAINALGDGFVRMERVKMEMAREFEAMRMEMKMKRTEMILESQQRIVETFAKAFSEKRNKKPKRIPTPES